jgi:ABC-type nickel/cobalt efflux system permease component RcnA
MNDMFNNQAAWAHQQAHQRAMDAAHQAHRSHNDAHQRAVQAHAENHRRFMDGMNQRHAHRGSGGSGGGLVGLLLLAGAVLLVAAYFGYSPEELWDLGRAKVQPFVDQWLNG